MPKKRYIAQPPSVHENDAADQAYLRASTAAAREKIGAKLGFALAGPDDPAVEAAIAARAAAREAGPLAVVSTVQRENGSTVFLADGSRRTTYAPIGGGRKRGE